MEAASGELRLTAGQAVLWPNACCTCLAPSPSQVLPLDAYAARWSSPATWSVPAFSCFVPICGGCRTWRVVRMLLLGLLAVFFIACAIFAGAGGATSWLGKHAPSLGLSAPQLAMLVVGPLLMCAWLLRTRVGPRVRLDARAAVLSFPMHEFANGARVVELLSAGERARPLRHGTGAGLSGFWSVHPWRN
jgi:hypothetical protein